MIRVQIEALRDTDAPGVGALQCYCFAAPSNRVVTGPLQRFAQMVRRPPFDSLGGSRTFSIGKEQLSNQYARSMVVTVGADLRVQAYSWVLRKHTEAPFAGCWLTVGVFPLFESSVSTNPPSTSDEDWL